MASRMGHSITFPGTEVMLTGQEFLGSSFFFFLKTRVTFAFLQSSATSPDHHDLSKMIMSGVTSVSASSLSTHGPAQIQGLLPPFYRPH